MLTRRHAENIILLLVSILLGLTLIGTAEGEQTAEVPALDRTHEVGGVETLQMPVVTIPSQDLIYIAELDGFKVPITIPKGSLSPKHRGKIWQTKEKFDADWAKAMQWVKEVEEELESTNNPNK